MRFELESAISFEARPQPHQVKSSQVKSSRVKLTGATPPMAGEPSRASTSAVTSLRIRSTAAGERSESMCGLHLGQGLG